MNRLTTILSATALMVSASLVQAELFTVTVDSDFNSDTDATTASILQMTANVLATSIYTDGNGNGVVDAGEALHDVGAGSVGAYIDEFALQMGFGDDHENLNTDYELSFAYSAFGTAVVNGPLIAGNYTSGTVDIFYTSAAIATTQVLSLLIQGSQLLPANFIIGGVIDYSWYAGGSSLVEDMFNFVNPHLGLTSFYDLAGVPLEIMFRYDTNIDLFSAVPTNADCANVPGTTADDLCRTATLNGSVTFVPEPATLALLGLGLLGLGSMKRKFQ